MLRMSPAEEGPGLLVFDPHPASVRRINRYDDTQELKMNRPPLPPFTAETAAQKVRMAEDAWNTRDPARVALAYTPDSRWRNRVEFLQGRAEIEAFLTRKWSRELDYRLIKELWAFREKDRKSTRL